MKKYLLLILICFLVYTNILNNAFISDDIPAIVNNPAISKIEWLNPYNALNSICYLIGGKNPFVYHLMSILLHSLAVCLVFTFLRGFFYEPTSLFGAALFATHPVATESVTWISGKPYIILAIFALAIYLLCRKGTRNYIFALLLFIYFCISSVHQALLVAGFVMMTAIVLKKINFKKALLFALIAIINLFIQLEVVQHRIVYVARETGATQWSNPVLNMAYSIFEHLRLLLYPNRLTLYHEPAIISLKMIMAELIIIMLIIPFLPILWRRARIVFYALALFVLCLAVTFSPAMISWLVAERYLYLGVISLSIILCYLYEKFKEKKALSNAFILIILIFAARTIARNEDWKTSISFWKQTAIVSPYSPRAHNNLADAYNQEGNLSAAEKEFVKAIRLKPNYAEAYHNLGVIRIQQGNMVEATKFFVTALTHNPNLYSK